MDRYGTTELIFSTCWRLMSFYFTLSFSTLNGVNEGRHIQLCSNLYITQRDKIHHFNTCVWTKYNLYTSKCSYWWSVIQPYNCYLQIYQALKNQTTNEGINWKRYDYMKDANGKYRNPFDRGVVTNMMEYFYLIPPMQLESLDAIKVMWWTLAQNLSSLDNLSSACNQNMSVLCFNPYYSLSPKYTKCFFYNTQRYC